LLAGSSNSGSDGSAEIRREGDNAIDFQRPYAFGRNVPCSLDAVIFGHVASASMDKMTGYGALFVQKYPHLWAHHEWIRGKYFSRLTRANKSNVFFRIAEKAREALMRRQESIVKRGGKAGQKAVEGGKMECSGKQKRGGAWLWLWSSEAAPVNKDHWGGYVDSYLPKAHRSTSRVFDFSQMGGNGREYSTMGSAAAKARAAAAKASSKSASSVSEEKQRQAWENKMFVGGTTLAFLGFLIFSGRIAFSDDDEY
jgi:hypothetical protein